LRILRRRNARRRERLDSKIPLYTYIEKKHSLRVEVLRSFDEYQTVPTDEEIREVIGADAAIPTDLEWEREIWGNQTLTRGSNWSGSKGNWIALLALLGSLLFSSPADAYTPSKELKLLDVDHVSFDWWNTLDRRDPYQPEFTDQWTNGAQFNLNIRALNYFLWTNEIHMDSVGQQLRNAGWKYRIAMDAFPVQPFFEHSSAHALDTAGRDTAWTPNEYPVVNKYGIRITFLDKK
jgi:hypothetical protein